MKKYVKPDLVYENFELSVGVAACTGIVFNKDGTVKSYDSSDSFNQTIAQEFFLFGSDCTNPLTEAAYSGYYGGLSDEGFAFNS